MVTVRVETDPSGAAVDIQGKGRACDSTPCEFETSKNEKIVISASRGKSVALADVVPLDDPTLVSLVLKPRKPGAGKGPGPGPGADVPPGGTGDTGTKPGGDTGPSTGSVDDGDLKIPSIYKKKDQ